MKNKTEGVGSRFNRENPSGDTMGEHRFTPSEERQLTESSKNWPLPRTTKHSTINQTGAVPDGERFPPRTTDSK